MRVKTDDIVIIDLKRAESLKKDRTHMHGCLGIVKEFAWAGYWWVEYFSTYYNQKNSVLLKTDELIKVGSVEVKDGS